LTTLQQDPVTVARKAVVKMGKKIISVILTSIAIAVSITIIISVVVNFSPQPFPAGWSPESRVQLAFGIPALVIATIVLIYLIIKGNFSDLIKDEKKYPSLGHGLMYQDSDQFSRIVSTFLQSVN
jgi:hypothetical protein